MGLFECPRIVIMTHLIVEQVVVVQRFATVDFLPHSECAGQSLGIQTFQ